MLIITYLQTVNISVLVRVNLIKIKSLKPVLLFSNKNKINDTKFRNKTSYKQVKRYTKIIVLKFELIIL